MDIAVNAPGAGPVQISGNIIAHSTSANGSAIILTQDAVNDSVTNNIIYDWHEMASQTAALGTAFLTIRST